MQHVPRVRRALATVIAALPLTPAAASSPPPEGRCPTLAGVAGAEVATDAIPTPLREGMVLDATQVLRLRELLPEEIWRHRELFFHPGMRMELGPCHRRYPVPTFYAQATARHADGVSLDEDGNLRGYVAGTPFPPEAMDPEDALNGLRWAWNLAYRWRGAGPVGEFRLVDMPSRVGGVQTYRGSFFFLQTAHRADLEETGFAVPEVDGTLFVAGGRFDEPFDARHLAWRQGRPLESEVRYREPDDVFVYVPTMRKMRRAATAWVDDMYVPNYRVSGDAAGGGLGTASGDGGGGTSVYGIPVGSGQFGQLGEVNPTAGRSIAASEHVRRGFTGMALRPNAYVWRVLREREVLAPLNATRSGYPDDPERNFGPSGLSVGSDRWEVRWAVVIEGRSKEPGGAFDAIKLYVDHQTRQPLYLMTRRRRGQLVDVGILVHRFSGDVIGYPHWPDGQKAFVFDPVAAVFRSGDGSGWRRENYDVRSTPAAAQVRRRFLSSDFLLRGR